MCHSKRKSQKPPPPKKKQQNRQTKKPKKLHKLAKTESSEKAVSGVTYKWSVEVLDIGALSWPNL